MKKSNETREPDIHLGDVPGHTKYLQGIDLPIKINSVINDGRLRPSGVSEMHIGEVDGETCIIITPDIVG